jgi:hypothetical protein
LSIKKIGSSALQSKEAFEAIGEIWKYRKVKHTWKDDDQKICDVEELSTFKIPWTLMERLVE